MVYNIGLSRSFNNRIVVKVFIKPQDDKVEAAKAANTKIDERYAQNELRRQEVAKKIAQTLEYYNSDASEGVKEVLRACNAVVVLLGPENFWHPDSAIILDVRGTTPQLESCFTFGETNQWKSSEIKVGDVLSKLTAISDNVSPETVDQTASLYFEEAQAYEGRYFSVFAQIEDHAYKVPRKFASR